MLINCKNCKKEYSNDVESCPECGNPTKKEIKVKYADNHKITDFTTPIKYPILIQIVAGTFLVVLAGLIMRLGNDDDVTIAIICSITYLPIIYSNRANSKIARIVMWVIYIVMLSSPLIKIF
ncbi:MAG: hypothetical protein DRG78_12165 [Epsilonproteobacteria bacterium]|nr:MAG: hypothetical protein DRG78_12165 [Campylobacterota bacterium]